MANVKYIMRYRFILDKLQNSRRCTFEEIRAYLEDKFGDIGRKFNFSKRTFDRDRDDIRELFSREISYNRSGGYYYIDDENITDSSQRFLEAFDVVNALDIAKDVSPYVYLEPRKPKGTEHLYGLLYAIRNRYKIAFIYTKFQTNESSVRELEPYALKEFKGRWYLLGYDGNKEKTVKSFGLDRISSMDISTSHFKPSVVFDIESNFRDCFGIISEPGLKPDDIILAFDPEDGKYIKSYPLHVSQKILSEKKEEILVKLTVCITHDLIMELLSF